MTADVLTWFLVSSAAGFVTGYLAGMAVRRTIADGHSTDPRRRRRAETVRVLFGVLLLLLAVVALAESARSTTCLRDAVAAQSDAQGAVVRAQIVLLESRLDDDPSNDRQAIVDYIAAADQLEQARARNPLEC